MRQPRARAQNPYSPSPPNRPQSVSQSLSPVPHLRLSRVLPSMFSLVPCPPSSSLAVYLLFWRYQSVPSRPLSLSLSLTLLFPPPRSHGNFFLFYAALYRCSCLLTHSLLQFFRRSLRPSRAACRRLPFSFSLSRAANDRAPIHPSDFSLSYLSNSTYFPLPPPPPPCPLVAPFICLPSPTANRTHHLHHRISTTYLTSRASFRRLYLKH